MNIKSKMFLITGLLMGPGLCVQAKNIAQMNGRELSRLDFDALSADDRDALIIKALRSNLPNESIGARDALNKKFGAQNWNHLVTVDVNKGFKAAKAQLLASGSGKDIESRSKINPEIGIVDIAPGQALQSVVSIQPTQEQQRQIDDLKKDLKKYGLQLDRSFDDDKFEQWFKEVFDKAIHEAGDVDAVIADAHKKILQQLKEKLETLDQNYTFFMNAIIPLYKQQGNSPNKIDQFKVEMEALKTEQGLEPTVEILQTYYDTAKGANE